MSAENLLSLAERCEAASGPDRDLDAHIWAATVGGYVEGRSVWYDDKGWVKHVVSLGDGMVRERQRLGDTLSAPAYTASLDAAMTLVPEGWEGLELYPPTGEATYWAAHFAFDGIISGCGSTKELALVSAALRARKAMEEGE